ncbi:MAG: ATP-binding protein [Chitinophagales bacterium]
MSGWWSRLFARRDSNPAGARIDQGPLEARLALYLTAEELPQVMVLTADDPLSLMDLLCKKTLQASHERGGVIPLLALREIVENLLHASFRDVVVSVLVDGSVVVSDHGPGIPDKEQALRPGFTTASASFRRYIRGVGSGLCVAQESLRAIGGQLAIEDNLSGGTVVTLMVPRRHHTPAPAAPAIPAPGCTADQEVAAASFAPVEQPPEPLATPDVAPPTAEGNPSQRSEYKSARGKKGTRPTVRAHGRTGPGQGASSASSLTTRQARLFQLFAKLSEVGPSVAASEAGLSLASAYRELVALEQLGLLEPAPGGKRRLTAQGMALLEATAKR